MSKAKILIVEDSLIVAYHLRKTLEKQGYYVTGVEPSGEGALTSIQKELPNLVMMDVMLSGKLDGIETAMAIRSKFRLPVIYLTALSDQETIQRAKISEPFGYVMKPFEDREIFTAIEMALYKNEIDQRLRTSEEKYFSTLRSISDGVILIDLNFEILFMNPNAERISGWRSPETSGRLLFDVLSVKDAGEHDFNPLQLPLSLGGANGLMENIKAISRSGTAIPIEISISPAINSRNEFSGLVMILKDVSEKLAHEKLLREVEKHHLAAILEGQEQERNRVAKDLHDGLGQMLNALKMKIKLEVRDEDKATSLNDLIDEAIQESIRISEDILPAKLRDFDLATCLKSLCNGMNTASGVPVHFESLSSVSSISQAQKINLYRIAQEAINNAMKHASASQITVQLNEEEDYVQLSIEDDGHGIARNRPVDQRQHHGLANMKERAEIMGGSFSIESDPERGTLIIVELPLKSNNTNDAEA